MRKYATAEILDARMATGRSPGLVRNAHRVSFDYNPREGYLYVRSRMISSRCNDNHDEFSHEAIKGDGVETGWHTFIGKPVFVNHHNDDHRRARGVIIDAALHEDRNPDGSHDTWVEGLMEVDAIRFPKLAKAILAGHIDRTSMGVDVAFSVCAVCNNKATTPLEYCQHIPNQKGRQHYRVTASGQRVGTLIREKCFGLRFFENSLLVEEPADPTALFLDQVVAGPGLEHLGMARTASRQSIAGMDVVFDPRVPPGRVYILPTSMARTAALTADHTASLEKFAHGGTCPACRSEDTIAMLGSAECLDCEQAYLTVEAAGPKYPNPADHPFFQKNPVHSDHIVRQWNEASPEHRAQGERWYPGAKLVATALASMNPGKPHPLGPAHLGAGIIANHSAQNGWEGNQHDAALVLHGGKGIGGEGSHMFASDDQRRKDELMLAGADHRTILKSPKVSDFAHLVEHGRNMNPSHPRVVVDRHALSVAAGKRMSDQDYADFPKDTQHYYGHVAQTYHDAAKRISHQEGREIPAEAVQAATWLHRQKTNSDEESEFAKANPTDKKVRLNKGRQKARENKTKKWNDFKSEHLPELDANPGTGYTGSRSRRGRQ